MLALKALASEKESVPMGACRIEVAQFKDGTVGLRFNEAGKPGEWGKMDADEAFEIGYALMICSAEAKQKQEKK